MSAEGNHNETIKEYTEKIAQEPDNTMHYALRGIFFQNEGEFGKAVEDFSKIINMKSDIYGNSLKAVYYNLRGNLLYNMGKVEDALYDFEQAINLYPEAVGRYFKRAEILEKENRSDEAIKDYSKIIELDPDNLEAYESRASIYSKENRLSEAVNDYYKIIELKQDKDNPWRYYYLCARLYKENDRFNEAIKDYSKALEFWKDFYVAYEERADCYEKIGKIEEAISDLETSAKYSSSNTEDSKLTKLKSKKAELQKINRKIEMDPQNIDAYFDRIHFWRKIKNIEKVIENYNNLISLDPENHELYYQRAKCFKNENRIEEAIKDYSKMIEMEPNDSEGYLLRAEIFAKQQRYDEAINDYTKCIEIQPNDIDFYFLRAENFTEINKLSEALNDYNKINEIDPYNEKAYFHKGEIYAHEKKWEDAVWNYSKSIELDNDNLNFNPAFEKRAEIYYFELKDFRKANADFRKCLELVPDSMDSSYYSEMAQESAAAAAKIEERNRVIENLSHSIKNLISTVIVPLEKLKQTTTVQPHIIQNALRGANLIREIVNAVNLSYKGSQEDLLYDVRHNSGNDAMSLASMFLESLKHSVSNMFDGKYFHNFMRKYFSEKEFFLSAKQDWANLSQSDTISELEPFLTKHFFHLDIDIADADQFIIGNEQGSAIKLLILIQELILNAVKYAAFVKKEDRLLKILFAADANTINIRVENTFVENVKTKTTGTGHVIISNFAKLLGTEPVVKKENGIYSLQITFQNFWEVAKK